MARKRSRSRNTDPVVTTRRVVKLRRSTNASIVEGSPRGVRRLVAVPRGVPVPGFLKPSDYGYRGVRTLIKKKAADGLTQPEARQAMLTSTAVVAGGVRVDGGGASMPRIAVLSKAKIVAPSRGLHKVKTPRPAPGGVRDPFGKRPI